MERDNASMLKAFGKGTALALLGLLLNPVAIGANGNIIEIKQISQPAGEQFALRNSDSNVLIFNQEGLRNTIRGDATPDAISVTSSALRLGSPGSDETFNNGALFNFSSANLATTGGYSNFDASEITIPSFATTSLALFDGTNTEAQLTGAFINLNVSQLGNDNDLGLNLSSHGASYQISITGNSNAIDLDVGGNGTSSQGSPSEFFVGAPNTDFDASITGDSNSVFNRIYSDGSNLTSDTVLSSTLDGANNEFASEQAGVSNRITADFDVDNSFLHIDQKGDSNEADLVLGGGNDYVQLDIRQNSTGSTGNDIELNWNGGHDGTSFYLSQDGDGHFIDLDVLINDSQGPSVFDITQTGSDQSATLNLSGGGQFVKVTQGP